MLCLININKSQYKYGVLIHFLHLDIFVIIINRLEIFTNIDESFLK